jgi:hypothetical protein
VSKPAKDSHTPSVPVPRVRLVAIVEDTVEGSPRTWATVLGTVPADAIVVERIIERNNAAMAKGHALALIDNMELLR